MSCKHESAKMNLPLSVSFLGKTSYVRRKHSHHARPTQRQLLNAVPPSGQAVELSPEDRELYERVETQGRQIISGYLQAGTLMQNYASVSELFSIVGLIRRKRSAALAGSHPMASS